MRWIHIDLFNWDERRWRKLATGNFSLNSYTHSHIDRLRCWNSLTIFFFFSDHDLVQWKFFGQVRFNVGSNEIVSDEFNWNKPCRFFSVELVINVSEKKRSDSFLRVYSQRVFDVFSLKKNKINHLYLRAPLHLRMIDSRKVFWGATKPRRDPGINGLTLF